MTDKEQTISGVEEFSLLITFSESERDWLVWMSLPEHDPERDRFGFVIGSGRTRDEAVEDAVANMEAVLERLQSPRGQIRERRNK